MSGAAGPLRAVIDLSALAHNFEILAAAAAPARVLAIVKANAYGHGLARVARTLPEAAGFGVARLAEAAALRTAGIEQRIVVLGGFQGPEEVVPMAELGAEPVLHSPVQLDWLSGAARPAGGPRRVWIKIDTGMHRLGFEPDELPMVRQRLAAVSDGTPVLMTHFARADDLREPTTARQIACFEAAAAGFAGERSLANSAGLLGWPASHADWVRPGIALYGISPFDGGRASEHGLRPVMTLRTRLVALKQVRRGEAVGYGGRWICPETMPIGVAAVGYADGYLRHAPCGTPVLVGERTAGIVGRVSMDLISIDLRDCPQAAVGQPVTLWGEGLPVERVAEHMQTIPYELVSRLGPRALVDETRG